MSTILPDLSEILIYTGEIPITVIVWSLFIGVLIATIITFIIKVKFGAFIRALLKMQANSPENAVTLEETGLSKSFLVRRGLKIHSNYQNMMVAITDDGKYYANSRYTTQVPVFKAYLIQRRRKKKSLIREDNANKTKVDTSAAENTAAENSEAAEIEQSAAAKRLKQLDAQQSKESKDATTEDTDTDDNTLHDEEYQEFVSLTEKIPKQRVKFDIDKAKFYIPDELHDRAASIYFSKPTKLIAIIGALIILAVIVTFSENIINILKELTEGFIESLKPEEKL